MSSNATKQLHKMKTAPGFIAALVKAAAARTRIITSPRFTAEMIRDAILLTPARGG